MAAPVELLAQVPLFQGLSGKVLKGVAQGFTERKFETGQEITSEGAGGIGFFVIESGEVLVTVGGAERRRLGRGDYFGEIALVDGGSRTATVTAASDGTMYGLTAWQFRPLVEAEASIAWPLLETMASRLRELERQVSTP
jgi:CRP/FNR family transcriptional regulator, cyclic AMP receptor protein